MFYQKTAHLLSDLILGTVVHTDQHFQLMISQKSYLYQVSSDLTQHQMSKSYKGDSNYLIASKMVFCALIKCIDPVQYSDRYVKHRKQLDLSIKHEVNQSDTIDRHHKVGLKTSLRGSN